MSGIADGVETVVGGELGLVGDMGRNRTAKTTVGPGDEDGSLGRHILAIGVQIPDQTAGRVLRMMSRSEGDVQQAAYGDITNGQSAAW